MDVHDVVSAREWDVMPHQGLSDVHPLVGLLAHSSSLYACGIERPYRDSSAVWTDCNRAW
eukprot:4480681-Amphidinium_carterae.1